MNLIIHKGDNLELLKQYPDNYFDSIVTDAPYGLGKEPNAVKLLQDWIDHGYHEIKQVGFMGKKWDAFVPQPILWKEVYRVLKPGGHMLVFFGTRTYDWGTIAIRLAGFEIRDCISWIYGSGFPKSMNISKSIESNILTGSANKKEFQNLKGTKAKRGNWGICAMSEKHGARPENYSAQDKDRTIDVEYQTEEAKQWHGWGTALKPAQELICMARKPVKGNIAENVLEHGVGGINIDDCRIDLDGIEIHSTEAKGGLGNNIFGKFKNETKDLTDLPRYNEAGRFPSNVIIDTEAAQLLDQQTGTLTSGKPAGKKKGNNNKVFGQYQGGIDVTGFGDSGGASRFFYCAKASQDERNLGCDHLPKDKGGFKNGSGRGLSERNPYSDAVVSNTHPTVKPISLMRYLLRLVTPPGGKTADIYAGSGTTGCAAYFEDIGEMVLMELDEDGTYIPIIEARTAYWSKENNRMKYLEDIKDKVEEQVPNQLTIF